MTFEERKDLRSRGYEPLQRGLTKVHEAAGFSGYEDPVRLLNEVSYEAGDLESLLEELVALDTSTDHTPAGTEGRRTERQDLMGRLRESVQEMEDKASRSHSEAGMAEYNAEQLMLALSEFETSVTGCEYAVETAYQSTEGGES